MPRRFSTSPASRSEKPSPPNRRLGGDGFSLREAGEVENLRGIWLRTGAAGAAEVHYEIIAEISDAEVTLPREPKSRTSQGPRGEDLAPSDLVQSDDAEVRRRARDLTADTTTTDAAAWALFQYTASVVQPATGEPRADAKRVLLEQRGSSTGRARLLAAMLRSLDIPAR